MGTTDRVGSEKVAGSWEEQLSVHRQRLLPLEGRDHHAPSSQADASRRVGDLAWIS